MPPKILTGAAGTDRRFWGKWASLGGGADRTAKYPLDAARIEANDEAALDPEIKPWQIFVPNAGRKFDGSPSGHRLTLVHSDQPNQSTAVYIFVFKMEKWDDFIKHFPGVNDSIRGGQTMVTASHGEIDYAQSFTASQIANMQSSSASGHTQNFFTSYTLSSLQKIAAPAISDHINFLNNRGAKLPPFDVAAITSLPVLHDITDRVPDPRGWRDRNGAIYR